MKKDTRSDDANLRKKAEKETKKRSPFEDLTPSAAEALKLVYELEVHQIELEMQAEELMNANNQLEVLSQKYSELYDFALPGYFTLSKEGKIIESNLSGSKMLGKERSRLKNGLFDFYVSGDTRTIFNSFLGKVFSSKTQQYCEVKLSTNSKLTPYVHITGIAAQNGDQCQVTVFDMTQLKSREAEINTILRTAMDGFFIIDKQGQILETNDSFCLMTGYSREKVLTMKIEDFRAEKTEKVIEEEIQRILEVGHERFESRLLCKNGKTIFVEACFNLITGKQPKLFCFMRDNTLRIEAQDDLEELFEFNNQVINNVNEGIVVYSRDLKTQLWNPYMENLTGIPASMVLGKQQAEVFPFLIDVGLIDNINMALNGEISSPINFLFEIRATGKKGWASCSTSPLRNTKGKIIGAISAAINITERKQAEDELLKSSELNRRILQTANDCFWLLNKEGKIIEVNEAGCDMLGYTREEMLSMSAMQVEAITTIEDRKLHFQKIFETGEDRFESKQRCKDGRIIDVEVSANLEPLSNMMVAFVRDITARKLSEEKFLRSAELNRRILQTTNDGYWLVNKEGNIIEVNQAGCNMIGYTREELLSMSIMQVEATETADVTKNHLQKIIETGEDRFESKQRRKDGRIIDVEVSASLEPVSQIMVAFVRDITARKLSEDVLRKSSELNRRILQTTNEGFWLINHGRQIYRSK